MTTPCPLGHITAGSNFDQWRHDRLTEARSILADAARRPSALVVIAARVVIGLTGDSAECAEAIDMMRALEPRPLCAVVAAAFPNGGAA